MKKLLICAASALLVSGCATSNLLGSSETAFSNFGEKVATISPSLDGNFENQHAVISKVLGVEQKEVDTPYGKIYVYSKEGYKDYPSSKNLFFTGTTELFTKSCKGEVYSPERFEIAAHEGRFNPLNYATELEINQMSENAVSSLVSSEMRLPYYLTLSYDGMEGMDKEVYRYRDSLIDYIIPFYSAINYEQYGLNIAENNASNYYKVNKVCYHNGKVVGAQLFLKTKSSTSNSLSVTSIYLPASTTDMFTKMAYDNRKKNLIGQIKHNKLRDMEIQKRQEERVAIQNKINEQNSINAALWEDRFNRKLSVGDPVCTPNNYIGFVENVSDKNIKVWFKGIADQKDKNYFFGNSEDEPHSKFTYRIIDEVTWVRLGDIAICNAKLHLN